MNSFQDVWNVALASLKEAYTSIIYDTWFKPMRPMHLNTNQAVFSVPSDFVRDILVQKYTEILASYLESLIGFSVEVVIVSEEAEARKKIQEEEKIPAPMVSQGDIPPGFSSYTFDNFIIGSSNKFAHAACVSVTNSTGDAFNPLFIYGESGLGKTHLLYSIRYEMQKKHPGYKIKYIKGDEFTNEMVECLQHGQNKMKDFREKYRFLDLLLIDDIQFIGGKESTQEEFFHTFNTLYESKKQIVLTSDRPPKEIKTLEDRLRTRFEWGLIADIQPPDLETRIAIINRKAETLNMKIPPFVTEYIAERLKRNIRQIEGAVKKLKALTMIKQKPFDLETAKEAIRDVLSDSIPLNILIERVITETSKFYSVSPDDLKGSKRKSEILNARQICMYILRENSGMSLKQIGEIFNKDHTTIIHSINKVEADLLLSPDLKINIAEIMGNVKVF